MSRFFSLFVCVLLASCGGGGGGEDDSSQAASNAFSSRLSLNSSNASPIVRAYLLELVGNVETFDSLRTLWGQVFPALDYQNTSDTQRCSYSGEIEIEVRENGGVVNQTFRNCRESSFDGGLNGSINMLMSNLDAANQTYRFEIEYRDLRIGGSENEQIIDGDVQYDVDVSNFPDISLELVSNKSAADEEQGDRFQARNLSFSAQYSASGPLMLTLNDAGGDLAYNDEGYLSASFEGGSVQLRGGGDSTLSVGVSNGLVTGQFDGESGALLGLSLSLVQLFGGSDALANNEPVISVIPESAFTLREVESGVTVELLAGYFFDVDADLLSASYSVQSSPENSDVSIEQESFFSMQFTADMVGTYQIQVTLTDPDGLSAQGVFSIVVDVDTDLDGITDTLDTDDDNDSFLDEVDAFPLDSSEWEDTDNDGVGNNADPDDDNDGTLDLDDAFPNDRMCSNPEEGEDGLCFSEWTVNSDAITADESGVIYYLNASRARVYRWDVTSESYLPPLALGSITSSDASATLMTYSPAQSRLYIAYDNGSAGFFDFGDENESEQFFVTLPGGVHGLAAVGDYILLADPSGAWNRHYIYSSAGELLDSEEWNRYSTAYAWNATLNRVYFYRDGTSPNDLHYEEIDPLTGEIISEGETPYHGDFIFRAPLEVSANDELVITGSGDIFNAQSLDWVRSIPSGISAMIWDTEGELIVLRSNGSTSELVRRNESFDIQEEIELDGDAQAIFSMLGEYYIVAVQNDRTTVTAYVPNEDTDGDGVSNNIDRFPLDPSASVDSDGDGYPDYWNDGHSELSSNSGLSLDSDPVDSICYLPEHIVENGCSYEIALPYFVPTLAVAGGNEIFLLSPEFNRVYRWSLIEKEYNSSLVVGAPELMAFSSAHNRLYFSYQNGDVTYIDLSGNDQTEKQFVTSPGDIHGLAAVGDYVLLADPSGAWNRHYIYSSTGELLDSEEWNRYSTAYAWNATLNRVYFFRDGTSPNDLHYEEIDPLTGEIISEGETPYHGDYSFSAPILISENEDLVLTGSGNAFDAQDLTWQFSISNAFDYGIWDNQKIVTLREIESMMSRVDVYSASGAWQEEFDIDGTPLGVFFAEDDVIIITHDVLGGELLFSSLNSLSN